MTTMIVHREEGRAEQSVRRSNTVIENVHWESRVISNGKVVARVVKSSHCWKMRTCQSVTESPGFQNALGSSHTRCCSSGLSIILES